MCRSIGVVANLRLRQKNEEEVRKSKGSKRMVALDPGNLYNNVLPTDTAVVILE